jgi:hypothetical protein
VTLIDVGEFLGDGINSANAGASYAVDGLFHLRGIDTANGTPDGTHMNNLGHTWLGYLLFQILSSREVDDATKARVRHMAAFDGASFVPHRRVQGALRDNTFHRYTMAA